MAKDRGIQLTADGDLLIKDGHLSIGETLWQNIYLILSCHKGEFKEYPMLGLGMSDALADDDVAYWKYAIRQELQKDGIAVTHLEMANNHITINAKYK